MYSYIKYISFLLLTAFTCPIQAQELNSRFTTELEPQFFDYFLSAQQRQFYLSNDGNRLLLHSELGYQLYNLQQNGQLLGEGTHVQKVGDLSASLAGAVSNRSLNREDAIASLSFEEGSEYYVFDQEGIVLMLDWNLNENILKAVDLDTGKELWKIDRYRYTPSAALQFLSEFANVALAQALSPRTTNFGMGVGEATIAGFGASALGAATKSLMVDAFITPFDGTGKFMLKQKDGYVGIDLYTGDEIWKYVSDVNVGFHTMTSHGDAVLVNFNPSYFKSSKNIIVKLDVQSGKEIWRINHLSDFREGRTYAVGDRLICDYYGAEVFDLNTGQRLLLSIDERTVKAQNTMMTMFGNQDGQRGTTSIASPSVIQGKSLYTATFKLGGRIYANDGSSKAQIQKYDLETGKQLWNSDKLDKGTDLVYASPRFIFARKGKAFGKSSLFILDATSGAIQTETSNIDGFVYREGAGDVLTDDYLYRSGKKEIYSYRMGSWKDIHEFGVKGIKLGKLQCVAPAASNLMVMGDEGIGFYDAMGRLIFLDKLPVQGAIWNNQHCYVFSNRATGIYDMNQPREIQSLPVAPQQGDLMLLSRDGNALVVIHNENASTGKKVMEYMEWE